MANTMVFGIAIALATMPVMARELLIGQSLGLTGGGAAVASQYHEGARCHFDNVNRAGGVRGDVLKLLALDDGGQRERTLENTKRLIETEKAFALFGYTAAAGAQAAFPLIEEHRIPLVGIASGGLGVHDKPRKMIFHVRASYTSELDGIVRVLSASGLEGNGGYGFVYNQDAKANLGAFESVMRLHNVKMVTSVAIDRNSTDMKAPVTQALQARPSVIVAITTAKAMAAFIKEARKQGYTGTIVSSSFAGDPLIAEAGTAGVGTIVAQVVPDPSVGSTAVVRDYRAALTRCNAQQPPSTSGLEGYISARVFTDALYRAGARATREALVASLESTKLDLGGLQVAFSPTSREGTSFVELLIISRNGRLKK